MINLLVIFLLIPFCCGEDSSQAQDVASSRSDVENLLILVDLQGALFYPKTVAIKLASIHNQQVAEAIKNHKQNGAKIIYVAEYPVDSIFWEKSIAKNQLPLEEGFNLSNESFHGFEGKMPSCRKGILLCQGHPLGEILGLVINQLSVWTQFSPQKIVFYTVSKERGDIVSVIGMRIGAFVEVNLVEGNVGSPQLEEIKEPSDKKPKEETLPEIIATQQHPVKKQEVIKIPEKAKQTEKKGKAKVMVTSVDEAPKESKKKPDADLGIVEKSQDKPRILIEIDESKLEYV